MMRKVFNMFDTDHNGHIDRQELSKAFTDMGAFLTEDELQLAMDKADTDKSGTIEYEEFISAVFQGGE